MAFDHVDRSSHIDIVKNPDVSRFLKECQYMVAPTGNELAEITSNFCDVPESTRVLPTKVIAIDGNNFEACVNPEIPFTRVGFVKLSNVLIDRSQYKSLGTGRFVDPFLVAQLSRENSSLTFAFPSSNIAYKGEDNVRDSFRKALDEALYNHRAIDAEAKTSLRSTLFYLASLRKGAMNTGSLNKLLLHKCPNCGAEMIEVLDIPETQKCPHCDKKIYPSDCLRIWEEVSDSASNQMALTRFTNAIVHLLMIHYIKYFNVLISKERKRCHMLKRKRMNGEGSIRQRKDGRWEYRLTDGYREDGKLNSISFYGKTQREVKQKLDEYLKKKSAGIDMSKKFTFAEWADIWFENHTEVSATTKEGYKYTLRLLKNEFSKMQLEDIKAMHVEQFLKRLRAEGRSDSGVAQCRGMLFQILNKAEANDLIHKNPVRYAEKMRSANPTKEKDAFTGEEVRLLMSKLPQDRMGMSIRLMLGTGMRTQEITALESRHIAEDGSVIDIQQAVVRIKGGVAIGPPKSRDSYRKIPVPPKLRYCAVRLRDTDKKFIWEVGVKGQPCNPSYFADKFKEAIRKVEGVRVLTPHCCRHTYVSHLQGLGVDIETIKSIVGHAEIDMTHHYLHVQEPIRQDAVTRFSDAFLDFEET